MRLWRSDDDGMTFTPVETLSEDPAAYSELVRVDRRTVGLLYETGDSAFVEDRSAYIRFPCPVREAGGGEYLFASLLLVASDAATDPDAMMAVLNSVSSALAAELGCPATGLTTTPPQRVPAA